MSLFLLMTADLESDLIEFLRERALAIIKKKYLNINNAIK